jgi:hypothetical protein
MVISWLLLTRSRSRWVLEHGLGPVAAHLHVEDMGEEGLVLQALVDVVGVQLDGDGVLPGAVQHRGNNAFAAQPPRRALAATLATLRLQFVLVHVPISENPVPD